VKTSPVVLALRQKVKDAGTANAQTRKLAERPLPQRNHEPKRSTRNFRHRVTLTDYLRSFDKLWMSGDAPAMFSSSHGHSEAASVEVRAPTRVWEGGQGVWTYNHAPNHVFIQLRHTGLRLCESNCPSPAKESDKASDRRVPE